MPFVIGGGSGGSEAGALAVNNNHIFATTTARNTYFTANPSEVVQDMYISVSGTLQKRVSTAWVDTSAAIRGGNGLDGTDAPAVIYNYSVNGLNGWTSTLDVNTHKYWRWSTDNGVTWTPIAPAVAKMIAEDGGNGVPTPYQFTLGANNLLELRKGIELIATVDENGFWTLNSLSTGNGDLFLGEGHYVGSAGQNVIFKNENSELFWHPTWGAINGDGTIIVDQTARKHFPVIQKVQPAGNQGVGQVDYNSTFTAVSNAAFLYLDIVPLETFSGKLTLTVSNAVTGNKISQYDFDANYINGGTVRVPFKRPIWALAGEQYITSLTKVSGAFLQVRANLAGTQPWREASFLTFADYNVFHAGNPEAQVAALSALSGTSKLPFSALRDVPTMTSAVAGIAKLGATMSINGNGELNTAISPTSIPIVANQAARLAIPQSTGVILAIQQDNGITYGIEANNDPSVAGNWKQIGTVATNVVSFNGRNGAVVPAVNDYNMEQIGLTDITTATKYVFRVDNGVPYIEEIA